MESKFVAWVNDFIWILHTELRLNLEENSQNLHFAYFEKLTDLDQEAYYTLVSSLLVHRG